MHRGSTDRTATIVRGHAWHVYPDPASPGVFEGDNPFHPEDPRGPGRRTFKHVLDFWMVGKNTPGILNDHHHGHTYLALTDAAEPPPLASGWFAEPARLNETFELDQRGDRWARLVRVANTVETPAGPLLDCEFQVDRS